MNRSTYAAICEPTCKRRNKAHDHKNDDHRSRETRDSKRISLMERVQSVVPREGKPVILNLGTCEKNVVTIAIQPNRMHH